MRERDEEGRPIATRNAGAFLSPRVGLVPVPSSLLEDTVAGRADESEVERRGPGAAASAATSLTDRGRWASAIATSVAVWVLLAVGLRLVLLATEPWADIQPIVIGQRMTVLMHTTWFWWVANACFVAVGIKLGMGRAPSTGWRRLASMVAAVTVCAVAVTVLVEVFGGAAAAFVAGGAVVWLASARWVRA